MGTNYYIKGNNKHVGKRSSAGMYCWACDVTLCKAGVEGIHTNSFITSSRYFKRCPSCGDNIKTENFKQSTAGRELGLNDSPYGRKKGVASCSSFTWAIDPIRIGAVTVVDEYGLEMTMKEFMQLLEECPVQYFHSIGKEFS